MDVLTSEGVKSCLTYVATEFASGLKPYDWYRGLVLAGALEHGLPEEYVEKIVATRSAPDPDRGRDTRLEAESLLAEFVHKHPEHKIRLIGAHDGQALA
jgi:hypothetical protein